MANIDNFENIKDLEDKSIQIILREIKMENLAIALKGASNETAKAVKINMSERAILALESEMDKIGSVPLKDVELVQKAIMDVILNLSGKGII